jgi:hypothetical protein
VRLPLNHNVPHEQDATQFRINEYVPFSDDDFGVGGTEKVSVEERRDIRTVCYWNHIKWNGMYLEVTWVPGISKQEGSPCLASGSSRQRLPWSKSAPAVFERFSQYPPDNGGGKLKTPVFMFERVPFI